MGAIVTANGLELAYEERGEGEPLLLIMGIGAQLTYWPPGFCDRLVEAGFRVIRFDNRDVGLSSKLDGVRTAPLPKLIARSLLGLSVEAPYTLTDMADDAAGLLDALDIEQAHVLGASMGGMIAQALAIAHPRRVRTLTSVMSHTGERLHQIAQPKAILALLGPAPNNREEAMARAVTFYRVVSGSKYPPDEDELRERAGEAYDRCTYPQGFMRHLAAICASDARTEALRGLRIPAAVIHGSEDPLVRPVGGRATARAIPGARLRVIEGMGHALPSVSWSVICEALVELRERGQRGLRRGGTARARNWSRFLHTSWVCRSSTHIDVWLVRACVWPDPSPLASCSPTSRTRTSRAWPQVRSWLQLEG